MSEYAEFIDVDDESMTWDGYQYAQVGQCHNLGDEVRELRAMVAQLTKERNDMLDLNTTITKEYVDLQWTVKIQRNTIHYWRGYATVLNEYLTDIFCLYGWGWEVGTSNKEKTGRVVDDIQGLRARVRELKQVCKELGGMVRNG